MMIILIAMIDKIALVDMYWFDLSLVYQFIETTLDSHHQLRAYDGQGVLLVCPIIYATSSLSLHSSFAILRVILKSVLLILNESFTDILHLLLIRTTG